MKKENRNKRQERAPEMAPAARKSAASNRIAFLGASIVALAVLFAAYSNHFDNSFHFDDSHVIQNNLYIHSLSNIPLFFTDARTFSSLPSNATYRPLLTLSYAIDYNLGGGLAPRQFHITQFVLLVILGVMLVAFFLRCMENARPHPWNRWAALAAATWFCIHTANSETMNLLSSRSDLVSTMAIIAAFLLYIHLPGTRRFYLYAIAIVIGALAKAPVVFFVPLLIVYLNLFDEETVPGHVSRSRMNAILRHVAPLFILAALLLWFLSSMNLPEWKSGGGDPIVYLRTQVWVWLHYARLFFFPVGLTADTDLAPLTEWYDTRFFAGLLFLSFLALIYRRTSRVRALRPVAFGIAWFAIGLLPTSIFPLAEYANEHRIFLPYIGLCLAAVWWLTISIEEWGHRRRTVDVARAALAGVFIVVIAANAVGTYQRNEVWKTEESLWLDVTQKSPNNGRALMNYGLTKMARGEFTQAKELFENARRINPNYWTLEINLGIVNAALGDHETAESHFRRAVELDDGASSQHYYAKWLVEQGRTPEAVPRLSRAIELSPATAQSRELLMSIFAAIGARQELDALVADTLRIAPSNATALAYRNGSLPFESERTYEALLAHSARAIRAKNFLHGAQAARAALTLRPDSPDALNNLGWALANLGYVDLGIRELERAAAIDPSSTLIRANLEWARSRARSQNNPEVTGLT